MQDPNKDKQLSLKDALDKGPVSFVFGAGASMDYGFPSWEGLKREYKKIVLSGEFDSDRNIGILKEWISMWDSGEDDRTIDDLVYEYSKSNSSVVSTFQKITFNVLAKCEAKYVSGGWVSFLANAVYEELVKSGSSDLFIEKLRKIRFITLNYDRSFEYCYRQADPISRAALMYNDNSVANAEIFVNNFAMQHYQIVHPWTAPEKVVHLLS